MRTHSIQSPRKGEGDAKAVKKHLEVLVPEAGQAIGRRDDNFGHLILYDQLEQSLQVFARRFEARANIREDKGRFARSLAVGPSLQSGKLGVQIVLLALPADSSIEHEQPPVGFANQSLNFGSRHASFLTHPNCVDLSLLDSFAYREWVQS